MIAGRRRIVVTGIEVCTPTIRDSQELINCLRDPDESVMKTGLLRGNPQTWFWVEDDRPRVYRADESTRLTSMVVKACERAWRNTGLHEHSYNPARAGTAFGTFYGAQHVSEYMLGTLATRGVKWVDPWVFTLFGFNSTACAAAIAFQLRGPSNTFIGLSGAAEAIRYAYRTLALGRADIMLCAGYDRISDFLYKAVLSSDLEEGMPSQVPGMAEIGFISDGVGVLVLESLEHAKQRKATILTEICGHASRMPVRSASGEVAAIASTMQAALRNADRTLSDVCFIIRGSPCLHFTTKHEMRALENAFVQEGVPPLVEFRSIFGYALGATSVFDIAAFSLRSKEFKDNGNVCLLNSFGAYSSYVSLVMQHYPD